MRIEWSPTALGHLEQLRDYIADNNPHAATETARRIADAVELLPSFPSIGRPGRVPHTRELVVSDTPFVVVYRVRGEIVEIIAVLHGARRWPKDF
jgi:addiction module RelE/StbE family toxin